ncbi:hypothetical protein N7536_005440 [Penicillium majusculum]|nr:hypothetical protein N7536_005440 [Penicillium majusculum]
MKYDKVDLITPSNAATCDFQEDSFPPLGLLHGGSFPGLSVLLLTERMDLQISGSTHLPIRIFNSLVQHERKQKTGKVAPKRVKERKKICKLDEHSLPPIKGPTLDQDRVCPKVDMGAECVYAYIYA